MLFILTGNGKGKTTGAIGMGIRAAGAGRNVLMIQFLKSGNTSEIKILKNIDNFEIKSFGRNVCISHDNVQEKDFQLARDGLAFAKQGLANKKTDFLILDEINVALHFGLLKKLDLVNWLKEAKTENDIVATGRYAPPELIEIADLITECKEIRHYFDKGYQAKKGIEF